MVGVDGSFGSDVALSGARREAATRGWGLTCVLAWDYLTAHEALAAPEGRMSLRRGAAASAPDRVGSETI